MNPPRPDVKTIFTVEEIDICRLPERRKNQYPKFNVYRHIIGYSESVHGAETLMRRAIEVNDDADGIYCFHINEHLLDMYEHWADYGIAWRIYSNKGQLIDHTWCDSRHYDEEPYLKFRGRPKESIRFKAGDIVEVLWGDEGHLAVATQSPIDIDWCWGYRGRVIKGMEKHHMPVTDETIEKEYLLDGSDDQAAVIDGPGYEYHDHIPTLNIMPLRFPLSSRLRKRFEGYWHACLRQDEEYRKQRQSKQ